MSGINVSCNVNNITASHSDDYNYISRSLLHGKEKKKLDSSQVLGEIG
jgi:hypothetical protein